MFLEFCFCFNSLLNSLLECEVYSLTLSLKITQGLNKDTVYDAA